MATELDRFAYERLNRAMHAFAAEVGIFQARYNPRTVDVDEMLIFMEETLEAIRAEIDASTGTVL